MQTYDVSIPRFCQLSNNKYCKDQSFSHVCKPANITCQFLYVSNTNRGFLGRYTYFAKFQLILLLICLIYCVFYVLTCNRSLLLALTPADEMNWIIIAVGWYPWYGNTYCHVIGWLSTRCGLVIGFIDHLNTHESCLHFTDHWHRLVSSVYYSLH
jgi:hypothetical protein